MKITIKQALAAACVLALGITAVGCSSTTSGSSKKSATLIISTLSNPFFVSVQQGAKDEAAKLGWTLDVQNANNSDQASLDQATAALAKNPSVLIVDPTSSDSGGSIVKAANQANVPVVAFDRKPNGGELKAFIGYDAVQAGKNAAKSLGEALGGKGKVIELQGILGNNVAQDRSKGFNEGIKAFPNIQIVAVQSAGFDRSKALDVMTNLLQAHPDVDGVYAANDEMAMGVISALKASNLTGKVKVVGNDGIADAITAIRNGQMYSTNAESPYALGQEVMKLAVAVAEGNTYDADTVLQGTLVDQAGVTAYCAKLAEIGDTTTCAS
jgi:ribose transport system substrate-binding protein